MTGPTRLRNFSADKRTATITPIREMRAGETLQPPYRVEATGVQAGEHTIRVTVTSRQSPQGVVAARDHHRLRALNTPGRTHALFGCHGGRLFAGRHAARESIVPCRDMLSCVTKRRLALSVPRTGT